MCFAGYYLSEKHTQPSIPEVIAYHSQNCGGLITRLRFHPHEKPAPPTVGLGHGMIHHTVIVFNGLAVGKKCDTSKTIKNTVYFTLGISSSPVPMEPLLENCVFS